MNRLNFSTLSKGETHRTPIEGREFPQILELGGSLRTTFVRVSLGVPPPPHRLEAVLASTTKSLSLLCLGRKFLRHMQEPYFLTPVSEL